MYCFCTDIPRLGTLLTLPEAVQFTDVKLIVKGEGEIAAHKYDGFL